MYLRFFNLREQPFSITPDPRFLFLSPQHEEALSHLLYGIHERKGFIEITGEVGTGKTILCRTLMDRLDNTVSTALIFNSYLNEMELLQAILNDFGITCEETTRKGYIDALNQYLLREFTGGRNAMVLIDEAQNLEPRVLEQLRMLSNLETERGKLVQVVLVGQPELRDRLATPHMRQLDQRIAVRYHIHSLAHTETQQYITHRLSVAGAANSVVFTRRALAMIYRHCDGIPRRLNLLCDRVLVTAYVRGTHRITARLVRQSVRDLEGRRRPVQPRRLRWRPALAGLALGALASVVAVSVLRGSLSLPISQEQVRALIFNQMPTAVQPLSAPSPLPQPATPPVAPPPQPVVEPPKPQVPETDLALARTLWQLKMQANLDNAPPSTKTPEWQQTLLAQLADDVGLAVASFQAKPTQLTQLSRPCFIEVRPQAADAYPQLWILVKGFADHVLFYQEPEGLKSVSLQELHRIWYGKLYLTLDQDTYQAPMLKQGTQGTHVQALQHMLKKLGYLSLEPSGLFGAHTLQAVKSFQRDYRLDVDGYVGQQTLMALFHFGGNERSAEAKAGSISPAQRGRENIEETMPPAGEHSQQSQNGTVSKTRPALSTRRYSIQVGSFRFQEEAERLRRRLTHEGYATWIQPSQVPGQGTWYRVRVGRFANRSAADQVADRLVAQEQLTILIAAESQ